LDDLVAGAEVDGAGADAWPVSVELADGEDAAVGSDATADSVAATVGEGDEPVAGSALARAEGEADGGANSDGATDGSIAGLSDPDGDGLLDGRIT
jgi:hypothetical protein